MKSRIRNTGINIGILIITTTICLTLVEIWLRLFYGYGYLDKPLMFRKFYQYDPEIGRVVSPNREGMYRTAEGDRYYYVKTNSDGFRGEEIQDRDTPKIAVLGDSFIFGYGVDQEYIFSTVLNELTDGRVINFGNSGTSIDQMYLLFKRYLNTYIFSDVIVYISPNDFGDLLEKKRYGILSPYVVKNNGTYEFRYPQRPWSDRCTYSETVDQIICNAPPSKKVLIKGFLKKFLITYVAQHRRLPPKILHEQEYNKAFLTTFTYDEFKTSLQEQTELVASSSKVQSASPTPAKIEIMDWILHQFVELSKKNAFKFHIIYDRLSQDEEEYLQYTYCQEHSCISFHKYRDEFHRKYPDYNIICPRNPHWNEIGHRLFAYVLYSNLFEQKKNK